MSLTTDGPVLLAGAGKMGTAMLAGWLARGLAPEHVYVQDPELSADARQLIDKHQLRAGPSFDHLPRPPAVIVVAVKPQVMDQVFGPLAHHCGRGTAVLSVAAGRSIESLERHLPPQSAVIRAMPNTPAMIGRGITGAFANASTSAEQKAVCHELLAACGDVVWLSSEQQIDAVTAVSGSGPAYVFLLAECLAKAGREAGLDAQTASKLARATVSGAGELMARSPLDVAGLRANVTSPGGTTAAALGVLMRNKAGLQDLMSEAVEAAHKRAQELAK